MDKVDVSKFIRPVVFPETQSEDAGVLSNRIRGNFFPAMPESWAVAAFDIAIKRRSPAVLFVGKVLWQQLKMKKGSQPLRITSAVWSKFKLTRPVVRRSLTALENGGLIAVRRFKHRSPDITIFTVINKQ